MHWKHALIARVEARLHAAPVPLPADARFASAPSHGLDYLRVTVSGRYMAPATALVRAATDLGTGYWAMVPMRLDDGRTVWVNRGFVPAGTASAQARATVPEGQVEIWGLLRSSEPGGSFLQRNRPEEDRWYSRDVAAMSSAKGLGRTVAAFVDAQRESAPKPERGVVPVAGLTVVHFPDNHLQYAFTWFAMAMMSVVGLALAWRGSEAKSR